MTLKDLIERACNEGAKVTSASMPLRHNGKDLDLDFEIKESGNEELYVDVTIKESGNGKGEKPIVTVREWLHAHNIADDDIDVQVDGTSCYIAVCFGDIRFTPEGEAHFKDALDNLRMDGCCIVSDRDEDYDLYDEKGEGRLALAEQMLYALAGYVGVSDYEKWFEGENAKLI